MTRADPHGHTLRLLDRRYDDPVVQLLVAETQQVYVERYGGPDETPMTAPEFAPPNGRFVLAYLDDEPAAIGGWRRRTAEVSSRLPGVSPAEIKRMFVRSHLRGLGLARAVLTYLESTAAAAGVDQLVLETGMRQPEAIALYQSSGYIPI
ncbi:MAG: GNAT family N-acetyltransferase, partial [Nocardioidaceae bacterium]